jgi:hypothetical protein
LQIQYERAVNGKHCDLPEDNLIFRLLPNIQMSPLSPTSIGAFTEKRECWHIMEHAETEAEKSRFLADSVNAVVVHMLPLFKLELIVKQVHM